MTKNLQNDALGDGKSPPLEPQELALRRGADQASNLVAESPSTLRILTAAAGLAAACKGVRRDSPTSCRQQPWLSIFFDGTGNNMDADIGAEKHSNVAKLYRVHPEDDAVNGIYRIYVPGVGTYFSEVRDNGGSTLGLGTGRMGDARLNWALTRFDSLLAPHLARAFSPANAIIEVNVALFGFSRGAAMARAFSNMLLKERCVKKNTGWHLRQGNHRLRIRFMGLFDTVASVGLPMSTNTVSKIAAPFGIRQIMAMRLSHRDYAGTRPSSLAFAEGAAPGADPAPGVYDGHQDWGGAMAIPDMVEQVRHFVAAHEIRNSFPLDSISVLRDGNVFKPEQFHETVFPGVHSDVGGSYRGNEGGRSAERTDQLGLIPLHTMYQLAIEHHVPLLANTAWEDIHHRDFEISRSLLEGYNYYHSKVSRISNLGPLINAHMGLYFAWRFRSIRRKQQGHHEEADEISRANGTFEKEAVALRRQIESLQEVNATASRDLSTARQRRFAYIQRNYGNSKLSELPALDAAVSAAQGRQRKTMDNLLRAKARLDGIPNMGNLNSLVNMYDKQLLADAKSIHEVYSKRGIFNGAPNLARRRDLRPHYKALIEAYENEFIHNKGMQDAGIIAFFDNYVHDSLAGFAKDATMPSDPRVIYLGGDEKYRYAQLDRSPSDQGGQLAHAGKGRLGSTPEGERTSAHI